MTKTEPEVFTISGSEMGQVNEEAECSRSRGNKHTHIYEQYVQPCLAEFLGSTLFIFVGCACVVGNSAPGAIQPALAHGLALSIVIMLFGQISGGHFNPAVTLCVYLCGGMSLALVVPYILAQMLGGIAGAGLVRAVFNTLDYQAGTGGAFTPEAIPNDLGKITLAELVLTMFLTTTVAMGAVNGKTSSQLAPFGIGLTVAADILAGGGLSGACMNPARAFGPAVVANKWDHHWIYWVGPMAGALCTVIHVRLFLGDRKTRIILRK
ncbi:aquaporin-8-like [Boleophthalmus pectinirostris]|uniref:aquaporin-8-like n=1 Tax=Boleophthalmus pectinirostris TaxID=150288 RepID=UPI000A1C5A01|nr:aquaporin-8-like [Boleophthalmus pectinirostris]